jgi:hypothetical protein
MRRVAMRPEDRDRTPLDRACRHWFQRDPGGFMGKLADMEVAFAPALTGLFGRLVRDVYREWLRADSDGFINKLVELQEAWRWGDEAVEHAERDAQRMQTAMLEQMGHEATAAYVCEGGPGGP